MSAKTAAVIVTFHSAEEIGRCLRSLEGVDEIVVVDNASKDETVARARAARPDARILVNAQNRGFAAAVNQGVRACNTDLIALLNPDVELTGSLDGNSTIAQTALRPEVAVVGGRLDDDEGFQRGFGVRALPTPPMLAAEVLLLNRLWPGNPWSRRWRAAGFDPAQPHACEQPAGAYWMFRREAFESLGGMDESFFPLWFEDVDFCRRARDAGFEVRYEPEPAARHAGAHSLRSMDARARQNAWYRSLLRYSRKHYSKPAALALRVAVLLGLALRAGASMCGLGQREDGRACWQTIRSLYGPSAAIGATRGDLGRTPAA